MKQVVLYIDCFLAGQESLEEEISETDMVEEELKRMELEQNNDVF